MAMFQKKKDSISQEKSALCTGLTRSSQTARGKNGFMSTSMIAVVVAIVVVFNLAVGQLPTSVRQYDLSTTKIYEISDTSRAYLSALKEDVTLTVVAEPDQIDQRISRFLERYTALSDHLTTKTVDPVAYPSALKEYDCEANSVVVQCEGKDQSCVIPFDDILEPDYYSYYYYGQMNYTKFDGEGQLTSAIDSVVNSTSYKLYRLTNHGESAPGTALSQQLTRNHFDVEELSLLLDGEIPQDCQVLLINQPTKDLSKKEVEWILTYLKGGGQVSLILGTQDFDHPNLDSLLKEYGLKLTGGYAGDTQRYYTSGRSYLTFFPELDVGSEVAGSLTTDDLALVHQALAMEQTDPARESITVDPFLSTTDQGLSVVSEKNYKEGKYVVGATASEVVGQKTTDETEQEDTDGQDQSDEAEDAQEEDEEENTDIVSRLTVLTANSLVDDEINNQFGDAVCNLTLYLNTLTCAFGDGSNISIPSKRLESVTNTITSAGAWSMLYLVVLPLVTLVAGFVIWRKRRKL